MPALFEAYVTNLGKYNEGELVGEYLKFPTTPEEVQALLKRIGVDGVLVCRQLQGHSRVYGAFREKHLRPADPYPREDETILA